MIHDADKHTDAPPPLTAELAQAMVHFANSHDDGSPQPRARYDSARNEVVVTSTAYWPRTRQHRLVHEAVSDWRGMKALLGY